MLNYSAQQAETTKRLASCGVDMSPSSYRRCAQLHQALPCLQMGCWHWPRVVCCNALFTELPCTHRVLPASCFSGIKRCQLT